MLVLIPGILGTVKLVNYTGDNYVVIDTNIPYSNPIGILPVLNDYILIATDKNLYICDYKGNLLNISSIQSNWNYLGYGYDNNSFVLKYTNYSLFVYLDNNGKIINVSKLPQNCTGLNISGTAINCTQPSKFYIKTGWFRNTIKDGVYYIYLDNHKGDNTTVKVNVKNGSSIIQTNTIRKYDNYFYSYCPGTLVQYEIENFDRLGKIIVETTDKCKLSLL